MRIRQALLLTMVLALVAFANFARAEEGLPGMTVDSPSNGFFALEGVQAEALSDQDMDAIRGGEIIFTLTPLGDLPPVFEGVNLNLTAPASGLNDREIKPREFMILCFNCVIIPG